MSFVVPVVVSAAIVLVSPFMGQLQSFLRRSLSTRAYVLLFGVGVLAASGVWLILRPRTFQVIIGLSLLSYAVNLFIIAMGRLQTGAAPILAKRAAGDPADFADPLPQALVLTAIVISFATTALLLVVLLAARGLTGTDHVDGREREP